MIRCSEAITKSLRACEIGAERLPRTECHWISSVDIDHVAEDFDNLSYWHRNTVGCVLFSQALASVLRQQTFDLAVEVGAHPALKGPALQVVQGILGRTVPYTGMLARNTNDVQACSDGLGYISTHLSDRTVDFAGYYQFLNNNERLNVLKEVPLYPWDHQRPYWYESRTSHAYRQRTATHQLLGIKSPDYSQDRIAWKNYLSPSSSPWILGHQIQGKLVLPGSAYIVSAFEAARHAAHAQPMNGIELINLTFDQALVFQSDEVCVETLISLTGIKKLKSIITANFTFHSADDKKSGPMALNASAQVRILLSLDNKTLAVQPKPHFGMTDVGHDQIYASLAKCGYEYSGPFKALQSVKRKSGVATGAIQNSEAVDSMQMLIHPATLDAAMHSIAVASSYPGDGQLSSMMLPVEIAKVTICLREAISSHCDQQLRFESFSTSDSTHSGGDVDIFPTDGSKTILRVEGLRTKPMTPFTEANDVHLFSETIWGPASPVLEPNAMAKSTNTDSAFSTVNQHVKGIAIQLSHRYSALNILG